MRATSFPQRKGPHVSGLFRLGAATAILGLLATTATAHVRWFVDETDPSLAEFPTYALTDPAVLIWIALGSALVLTAIFLDGRLPSPPIIPSKSRHDAMELLRVFTGVSFLLTAYGGALIAPHLFAHGGLGTALLFLQALIGIILISNHWIHHAALLMVVLFFGTMVQFGFVRAFEYVNVVGIALFLFFNHAPSLEWRERLKPYSVDVLRIFTGIALVTLGVTEKLTGAMLGQSFIANYEWNFMPALGFEWYSDQLFVLSAGAMEVVFGLILITGAVTRLNILAIAALMLLSNIVFLLVGENEDALLELVGHMPIIATSVILLLLGYGQRLKVMNPTLRWGPKAQPAAA